MKKIKRALSLVLVFCMLCTMTVTGFAADTTSGGQTDFMKVVHLDAGRKYFSVDSIKKIIDNASADGYNYLELGVGNDGLRFLLNDMSVTANGETYSSEAVSKAIHAGNEAYYNFDTDELTQSEMDEIISYAKGKGISIIPLINSPGHMDAIIDCMESLGLSGVAYKNSASTIDLTNTTAVAFTKALIQKYVNYFAGKGCTYFNMGADEYANDVSNGFAELTSGDGYKSFVTYVNDMAKIIEGAGMTPMAFNDGIYYNYTENAGTFDTNILVSYWTSGWPSYAPASASFLANKGFKILNTNDAWYYVLGNANSTYTLSHAQSGVQNTKYNDVPGDNDPTPVGSMLCVWCDSPSASYNSTEEANIADLMKTFATNNPEVFTVSNSGTTTPNKAPAAPTSKTITVPVGGTVTETVSGDYSNVTTANESIATVTAEYTKTDAPSISYNASASVSKGQGYTDGYTAGNDKYPSKNIIDNNANTFCWYPDAQTAGKYMQVDLGAAIPFGAVRLTTPFDARDDVCTNAAVKVSADRSTWETIGSYTGEAGKSQIFTNTVDTVRYIRVELTTAKNTWWKLAEIEWGNVDASNNFTRMATSGTVTQEASGQTTLTFTGVAAGTTTVQVGNATYTVNVVGDAPSNAPDANPIYLEYWITNFNVYETKSTNSAYYKAITTRTDGVRTETGVDVSTLAPEHAYSDFDGWKDVYYWQTMRLDAKNKQTNDSGDDETADGTTLTHIRYLNNAWQYQTLDGTWTSFKSGDQLVAYYLQKTDVTKEITTYAKDWGYSTNTVDGTPNTSSGKGQVALTVAVVYPDGTVSPAESDMYSKSTTIFNYWDNRDIGIVAPTNNSDYDISKITVTDGKRNKNTSQNQNVWYSNDSITWNKTTNDAGSKWYDEKTVWDETTNAGTTPMVNGKTSNITWSAKNTAKLVLIYLKPVQKETNLNVVYWDDNENKAINANPFQIAMKYNQGDVQPSFVTSLTQNSPVHVGEFTLDDDAYVTNSSGVNQTFNKDLSIVQGRHTDEIDPKYGSGLYKYASANISKDGKTLTLHYNLKPGALTKNYIVDFGKSVDVPITDLIDKTESVKKVEVSPNAKVNADNSITYTPSKILTGTDFVKVTVTYSTNSTQSFTIGFTPASNVMYEESFVKPEGTEWKTTGDAENDTQADTQEKEVLGKEGIHGYDESYETDSEFSNDSAYQAQLTIPSGKDFTETKKATFTFTGTGFDVISECGKNTGMLLAVVKDASGTPVKSYLVDTYFTGDEKGIISGKGILDYQVPVVRCMGLTQATYTVDVYGYLTNGSGAVKNAAKSAEATTEEGEVSEQAVAAVLDDMSVKNVDASEVEATCMDDNSVLLGGTGVAETAAKSRSARATAATSANVYIDGVRVYNTLNDNNGAKNYIESEQNVKYESVYDYVKNSLDVNEDVPTKPTVYVEYDGDQKIWGIADYKQQGPENEVYLTPGSAIAFALNGYKEGNTVQISAKAISENEESNGVSSEALNGIATASEMYYTVQPKKLDDGTYYVLIDNANDSDAILSLSNLKISSNIQAAEGADLKETVLSSLNEKAAFTPETFKVSAPETLKCGKIATAVVKTSIDVANVYVSVDDEKETKLEATNKKAVENNKTNLYSFTTAIKSKKLGKGEHTYKFYAVNAKGDKSDTVTVTVNIT